MLTREALCATLECSALFRMLTEGGFHGPADAAGLRVYRLETGVAWKDCPVRQESGEPL